MSQCLRRKQRMRHLLNGAFARLVSSDATLARLVSSDATLHGYLSYSFARMVREDYGEIEEIEENAGSLRFKSDGQWYFIMIKKEEPGWLKEYGGGPMTSLEIKPCT